MSLSCIGDSYTAIRNTAKHRNNTASVVTRQQVDNYVAGKKRGLERAIDMVKEGCGGIYTAKNWDVEKIHDPYAAIVDGGIEAIECGNR